MRKPGIFVSSTFYDLRQIRADLHDFIEGDLDYRSLISELASFPVDPDADTIENSKKQVQDNADILVLIIGSRYGYIPDDQEKSITNMEYEVARAKGIPIYAFIEKSIISTLPTWRDNPDADFSSVVDTTNLFSFVDQVRSSDRVWTYGFESAQEIVNILRNQFAYLMHRGLEIQSKLKVDTKKYSDLSGESLKIAIEKEIGWQGYLFSTLVDEELSKYSDLRKVYKLGVHFGVGERVPESDSFVWMRAKVDEATRLASGINKLINISLNESIGSLDIQGIAYSAREIGRAYLESIEWALRIRKAFLDEDLNQLQNELSKLTTDIIEQIEKFPNRLTLAIDDAIAKSTDDEITINIEFVISVSNAENFSRELDNVKEQYSTKYK
jgi:hypothetical protein